MLTLVIGGTGTVGRLATAALAARGHEVRALSRHGGSAPGVTGMVGDVTTGAGLRSALDGVRCVVDCGNVRTLGGVALEEYFVESTRLVGRLAAAAGVRHHVVLSIVGIDAVAFPYYQAKLRQERAVLAGPVPATVLRTTQFHEFVGQVLRRGRRGPVALVPSMLIQPVAAAEVAQALADLVDEGPAGRAPDVGGPRPERLPRLARRLLAYRGERAVVVPVRSPGRAGRAMRSGALLLDEHGVVRGPDFAHWLAAQGAR